MLAVPSSRARRVGLAARQRLVVVRLAPPRQHVGVVDARREVRELLDGAAPRRATTMEQCAPCTQISVAAVAVEVELFPGQRLALPQQRLGPRQFVPDRVAQVRQVEPAEDAVPVGVVALGPADGPARVRRVAALAAERRRAPPSSCASGSTRDTSPGSCASARRGPARRRGRRSAPRPGPARARARRSAASGGSDQPSISR